MKYSFLTIILLLFSIQFATAQTAHDLFMQHEIKMNQNNDPNHWVHADNYIETITENDWNSWKFGYLGLEGNISTSTQNDFTNWQVEGADIVIEQDGSGYNSWTINGEKKSVNLTTTNWNTWVITGDLVSGLSTVVTDDFSEWEIQSGDWSELSPHFRASVIFISTISSTVLKDFSM